MKMANSGSCCKQRSLTYDRLSRCIERNVEHEPIGYRPQRAKEADVVFDMLEDIETKEQVVMLLHVFGSPDSEFYSIGTLDHSYCL